MIDKIMFAMAKEFGWTPDQILALPYRLFMMYSRELTEYYEEAANSGNKRPTKFTDDDKRKKRELLEKFDGTNKTSR